MKTTTTLYDIIQSELIKAGHDEFINNNRLTFFDDNTAFMQKVLMFDNDVKIIVDKYFFKGLKLDDSVSDNHFKRTFINRFFNRQIAFQTMEVFASQVVYTFMINQNYLNNVYDNLDDFVLGKSESKSDNDSTSKNDNRSLFSSLPQDNINLNVDDTVLNYGDTNNISRAKTENSGNSNSLSTNHNLDNLIKSSGLLETVFIEFDKKCFLQIW